MATVLKFEDESYSIEVFINKFDKITIQTENKKDENDYSVLCLENDDVKLLIKELNKLLKINK